MVLRRAPAKHRRRAAGKRATETAAANPSGTASATRAVPAVELADRLPLIVAIGASAGGLEAATQLFSALPADTGMSFVLLQHLAPDHPSMMANLLGRATGMPVSEAAQDIVPKANRLYILPPDATMVLHDGVLRLSKRTETPNLPIDTFMRSLAEEMKGAAIGIVLSGTASDGTQGLRAIKDEGGITFAQSEHTAQHAEMPRSAIATGCVDFILGPQEIAEQLARIARNTRHADAAPAATENERRVKSILDLLRNDVGVDFSHYKPSTIRRRIARRMALHGLDNPGGYAKYLRENPTEVKKLFEDLLIPATRFFRDSEAFRTLQKDVLPRLFKGRAAGSAVRVWSVGCSTGEETYSLAILLLEHMAANRIAASLQLFGTDLSERAVDFARAGHYPPEIERDVSRERLERYFAKAERGYVVSKAVRDVCIFARHNILREPPFSHLDLVSCRNVLIYMDTTLQHQVLPILHYSLNPGAFMLLGSSENVSGMGHLFAPIHREHKIYSKQPSAHLPAFELFSGHAFPSVDERPAAVPARAAISEAQQDADRIILNEFSLPGALVDGNLEIVQFRGDTSPYLAPAPGAASLNLLKMARGELAAYVRTAVEQARRRRGRVRREGLSVPSDHGSRSVTLNVVPLRNPGRKSLYLVLFEPAPPAPATRARQTDSREVSRLKAALASGAETMRSLIEEYEAAKEEFQAANEEIASANEELQSTNEELETSKEELQSANEELNTVNDELRHRNIELNEANNDLSNLIGAMQIPMVMVDAELRIRRFSSSAEEAFRVIRSDFGRRLTDIRPNFNLPELEELAIAVIASSNPRQREVQDERGRWFMLRLFPYRTTEQRVEGVVLTLVDIDALKRGSEGLQRGLDLAESIINAVREPLLVLDEGLRVVRANEAFHTAFGSLAKGTDGIYLWQLAAGSWDVPKLRALAARAVREDRPFSDFRIEHRLADGRRAFLLNGRRLFDPGENRALLLLAMEDVTDRGRAQRARAASERVETVSQVGAAIGHEINNPLNSLAQALFLLGEDNLPESARAAVTAAKEALERTADAARRLPAADLGAAPIQSKAPVEALERAMGLFAHVIEERPIKVRRRFETQAEVSASPSDLFWLFRDLLRFLLDGLPAGRRLVASARGDHDWSNPKRRGVRVTLGHNGPGLEARAREALFEPGIRDKNRPVASLNLWICRAIAEQYGGSLHVRSTTRAGRSAVVFSIFLPTSA